MGTHRCALLFAFLAFPWQYCAPLTRAEQGAPAANWRAKAVAFAREVGDAGLRSQLHYELVYVLARSGDIEDARRAALEVDGPQQRIYAHSVLAKKYHELNNDAAALTVLEECQSWIASLDARGRDNWIPYMVRAYAEAGYLPQAEDLASKLRGPFQSELAMQDIAANAARRGNLDYALTIVERLGPERRTSATGRLIATLADAGRLDDAQALAKALPSSAQSDYPLAAVIKALLKEKRQAETAPLAAQITDPRKQAEVRGEIAASLAIDEGVSAIEARIDAATTLEEQLPLFPVLIDKLVAEGRLRDAAREIDAMVRAIEASPRPPQPDALGTGDDQGKIAAARTLHTAVAIAYAQQGEQEQYARHMALASEPVVRLSPQAGLIKFFLLAKVVNAQLSVRDYTGARELLRQLQNANAESPEAGELDGFLVAPFAGIVAKALVQAGDVEGGIEAARLIPAGRGRGNEIGQIAAALIERGRIVEAKSIVGQLDANNEVDLSAFRDVGRAMVAAGRDVELERWLDEMPTAAVRSYACLGAAEPRSMKK